MAERSTVTQVVQIGIEATPGTAVAASKRLGSFSIEPKVESNVETFRPIGVKYPTVQALNQEWASAKINSEGPAYDELQYLLSSVLTTATVAQVMDGATGTGVYEWTFDPSSTSDDVPKTYTVEQGSSVRAQKFSYAIVTDFSLDLTRDDTKADGTILGRSITDGIVLTTYVPGTFALPLVPILPSQIAVYLDTTSAGLGGTRLTRVKSAQLKVGNRYRAAWFLDNSQASFVGTVEDVPDATLEIMVEADAAGMALLAYLRNGATAYVRLEANGPNVYTGGISAGYRLWWDLATKFQDVGEYSDEDGVYAIKFTLAAAHDPAWGSNGRSMLVKLRNKQATL